MSKIIKLNTPIQAHGEEVAELTLEPLTARDARLIGVLPYRMTEEGTPDLNLVACAAYIARSAGIPPSSVDQLDLPDLNTLAWTVAGFFLTADSATSESSTKPSTTPHGSGS